MKMTPGIVTLGSFIVFWASISIMVIMPLMTMKDTPSQNWRPLTKVEEEGHRLYVQNGCSYCHSLFIRVNDWGHGAERLAEAGDFVGEEPVILGSERTGPDLSEEAGERPDDWHMAHFINPRHTSPVSFMPNWEFLGTENLTKLTAYLQSQGFKEGDLRVARQQEWKAKAVVAYNRGADANIAWLHDNVPQVWREMPNPYPALPADLKRGERIYQQFCTGCHGPIGDGQGPAAANLMPPPLNFTLLRRNLVDGKYIGGIIYYQVMNGITGTAMPYFKKSLESEKIWDLANYVGVNFIGYTDGDLAPKAIPASYEPQWRNPYTTTQPGKAIQ